MERVYGTIQFLIAIVCVGYAILHGYGQLLAFADRLADPEYSRVMLFGKFLVPLLFLLVAYRLARAGLAKFKPASQA